LMGKTHENIKTIRPLKRRCNCWFWCIWKNDQYVSSKAYLFWKECLLLLEW
jgi:hypothetical protein